MSTLSIEDLTSNYLNNPLGIGLHPPFFSWKLVSEVPENKQTAYRLQVTEDEDFSTVLWDTDWVPMDESVHIEYHGPQLEGMTRYYWRVKVKDQNQEDGDWSEIAHFETGLRHEDWQAKWIEPEDEVDPKAYKPAPFLRRDFSITGEIAQARLYVTAHGLYEAYLNGKRVGDQVFTPGNTDVVNRLQYQAYDVTKLLNEGENCMGVMLGDGWYRGAINVASLRNAHGEKVALLSQLRIIYSDGTTQLFTSDENWKTSTGPIVKSDPKKGEIYDARLEMAGWNEVGFDDAQWRKVNVAEFGYDNLIPSESVPVRKKEVFKPERVFTTPAGEKVIDFGQNLAGIVRMRVKGQQGARVKLTHSEVLDKDGNFALDYFGTAVGGSFSQVDEYILKGGAEEVYEPRFTVHGFRYVRVEGYPSEINPEGFTAIAIYSDMEETGFFECSNEKLNQLFSNIKWSMKGNFLDIPTDCPTRERAGWTGDAQIFVHTGSLLMNDVTFYSKWIKDVSSQQYPDGKIRNVVPDKPLDSTSKIESAFNLPPGSSGWGDAVVIIPWTLYEMFGNKTLLEEEYESMKRWVEYERKNAEKMHWTKWINPSNWFKTEKNAHQKYIWDTNFQLGEWLEPDILLKDVWKTIFRNLLLGDPIVATAYFEVSTRLLSKAAGVLGKQADQAKYHQLADKIRDAYIKEFIKPDGTVTIYTDRQAPYVRSLAFDLYTEDLRSKLEEQLIQRVEEKDRHLFTGFLSTPFLLPVLSQAGELELAYEVLLQEDNPSWLYAINQGATTIWEDWEGISEEGVPTASQNHYSKGAVASWFFEYICGIQLDPEVPAYKHFYLRPEPGGGLTSARAVYRSIYGEIVSEWKIEDDMTTYRFTVPANTSASLRLLNVREISTESEEILPELSDHSVYLELTSGSYTFKVKS